MKNPRPDFQVIFQVLADFEVDFIVVGGVCAVLHGAPISTFDLDLVHSRSFENIKRLMKALNSLDACFRDPLERKLVPKESHLSSPGHQLLMTRAGPLDLLGEIGHGRDYDRLVDNTVSMQVAPGLQVAVLDLETLISTKEEAGRDKDKAVLPILRKTLEEKNKT
ncbi:hypothetical protein ACFLU6_04305 [Acidobacteriota bacterium]